MSVIIKGIIKVMQSSRNLTDGYNTFSSHELSKLEALLELLKEEIKQEVKTETLKIIVESNK